VKTELLMASRSDLELLAEFARAGAQSAFAELVHRHVDLVYTAARRQVRDPHLAEDVTQTVFLALAQKAGSIKSNVVLEGWLLSATRYAAQDALRRGGRRQRHETVAAQQRSQQVNQGQAPSSDAERQEMLDRLDALLDVAMSGLSAASRDAVVLRFFENKSFSDVGRELGIGEQAAKQRVSRGLRQLRKILVKSGLDVPLEGLGAMLGATGILPAPPGLAHSIIAASAKVAIAAGSASVTKGALTVMAWTKAKVAATAAVGLLLLSGSAAVVHHYATDGSRTIAIKPGTPLPAGVRVQPVPTGVSWMLAPSPQAQTYNGPPLRGTVVDAAGKPVADAEVLVSGMNSSVMVYPTARAATAKNPTTKTSADGTFKITPTEKPVAVVARCAAGYGAAVVADPSAPILVSIQPWARLEGTVRNGSKPVPHAKLQIAQFGDQADFDKWRIVKEQSFETDDDGHYVLDRVVPGHNLVGRTGPHGWMFDRTYSAEMVPGKTTVLNIGGNGRQIIGHLPESARNFSFHNGSLRIPRPAMVQPANWNQLDDAKKQKLQQEFWNTPEFRKWQQTANMGQFDIGRDGTFKVEDVPAGTYAVSVQIGDSGPGNFYVETAGWGEKTITVPPVSSDLLDVPLDIGDVDVTLTKRIAIGESAPEVEGDSQDGSSLKLSDFRGKYVLLHLWASERRDLERTNSMLKELNDRFAADPRFVILGVNADSTTEAAKKAIADQQFSWPQILLHGWDDKRLPRQYTYSPALLFLIDPDGHLLSKNIDVATAMGILQRELAPRMAENVHVEHQLPGQEQTWGVTAADENLARKASFSIVDGNNHNLSGALDLLHDAMLPNSADAPSQNFFFSEGTLEGRFKIDLGSVTPIGQVKTYSWHKSNRGPQVYRLFGASGDIPNFNANPKIGTDPTACGWTQLAIVDTRPQSPPIGGRYIVQIADPSGKLGSYRYLLFETFVTETNDYWGHTFYSEIEVTRAQN
jgi:RNA polymerase sigma factor (sigma-70 family)